MAKWKDTQPRDLREHVPSHIPAAGNVPSQGLGFLQRSEARLRKGSRRNLKIERLNITDFKWTTRDPGCLLEEDTIKKHKQVATSRSLGGKDVIGRKHTDGLLGAEKFCFLMWVVVICLIATY